MKNMERNILKEGRFILKEKDIVTWNKRGQEDNKKNGKKL